MYKVSFCFKQFVMEVGTKRVQKLKLNNTMNMALQIVCDYGEEVTRLS